MDTQVTAPIGLNQDSPTYSTQRTQSGLVTALVYSNGTGYGHFIGGSESDGVWQAAHCHGGKRSKLDGSGTHETFIVQRGWVAIAFSCPGEETRHVRALFPGETHTVLPGVQHSVRLHGLIENGEYRPCVLHVVQHGTPIGNSSVPGGIDVWPADTAFKNWVETLESLHIANQAFPTLSLERWKIVAGYKSTK